MNQATFNAMANSLMAFLAVVVLPLARGLARFGDAMADFQRRDFEAIEPALLALVRGEKPPIGRYWIERTKGGSKDSDIAVCLLWLLAFSRRPLRIQIGANDQQQADEIRLILRLILRTDAPLNRMLADVIEIQSNKIINKQTGSMAEILTADHRGSHGSRPDVVLINELSHIGNQEFAETLMDNLDKMPNGLGIIATNAGHIGTWQESWHLLASSSDRWHFSALTEPSPWIDSADLEESQRRNSQARFNRLWRGIWVRNEGDALSADDIEAAITLDGPKLPTLGQPDLRVLREKGHFVAGLDLSTKRDRTALVVLESDSKSQRVRLAHVQSWKPGPNGVDLQHVRGQVIAAVKRFGCSVYYDPHQAHLLAADLRTEGVSTIEYPFTGANCNELASVLLQVFRERRIDLWRDEQLIGDLGRLCIVEKSFGYKLEASHDPNAGHADSAFALAIALPRAIRSAQAEQDIDGSDFLDYLGFLREMSGPGMVLSAHHPKRPWAYPG